MFDQYLITGATGFLGRAVAEELVRRRAQVHALVLHNDPYIHLLPKEVHTIVGDVCVKNSLADFFADAGSRTCVIHCAGVVSVASRPGSKLYQVNVGGTWQVLRQCMKRNVGRLIHVSSVHAIPEKPKGCIITEDCEFSPGLVDGDYAKSKAIATELVFDAAKRGLNASIVFPSGIIGPGDIQGGSFTSMVKSFLSGKLPFAVRGGYDFVDVRDVAEGILACSESGEPGKGYILSGHHVTIRKMLQLVGKAAKLRYRPICLPLGLAKLAAPYYERRSLREQKPLFFTPYSVAVLASNGCFSHAAASERFAYQPRPAQRASVGRVQAADAPFFQIRRDLVRRLLHGGKVAGILRLMAVVNHLKNVPLLGKQLDSSCERPYRLRRTGQKQQRFLLRLPMLQNLQISSLPRLFRHELG